MSTTPRGRYDEINLNCGCPSERVAGRGAFGAALMRSPAHVAELCGAMAAGVASASAARGVAPVPISVKCRIGVDDDDSYEQLAEFVAAVTASADGAADGAAVRHIVVHARKAILGGLSPEENRRIPPLK